MGRRDREERDVACAANADYCDIIDSLKARAEKAAKDRRSRQNDTRLSAGGSLSLHQQMVLMAERDALREQLATVTRELDMARQRERNQASVLISTERELDAAKAEAAQLAEKMNEAQLLLTHDDEARGVLRDALASTDAKDWFRAEKMKVAGATKKAILDAALELPTMNSAWCISCLKNVTGAGEVAAEKVDLDAIVDGRES